MVEDKQNEPEVAETETDPESTGNQELDKRLASGVLQGDRGTETAQVWISAFLIAALGFLVYLGSFSVPLHGADLGLLRDSDALHRLVTAPKALELLPTAPLSVVGLAASCSLVGGRVDAIHAISILFHLGCAILVFLIARRLLPKGTPEVVAMLAGLLFVAHPAVTEPVNYLNAFPVLQSSFFGLAGILLLLRGAAQSNFCAGSLAGAVFCFALAFGSETSALLLPLAGLGLLQLTPPLSDGARVFRRAALPVLVLTLVALWLTGRAAGILDAPLVTTGIVDRASAFLGLCGKVLVAALWPFSQTVLPEPGGIVPAVLLLVLAGVAIAAGFKGRALPGQVGLWVLISAFGIACYGPADLIATTRFVYLPVAGLAILLPWALLQIPNPAVYRAASGIAAVLILVLGVLSFQRGNLWKDPVAFWTAEAERRPESIEPLVELGRFQWASAQVRVQAAMMDPESTDSPYASASEPWRKVLALEPGHPEAEKHLGMIAAELGQIEEAEGLLESSAIREPESQQVAIYLAMVKEQKARAGGDSEAVVEALRNYRRAERLGTLPPSVSARYGMLAANVGDFETGLPRVREAAAGAEDGPLAETLKRLQAIAEQAQSLNQRSEQVAQERPDSADALVLRSERLLMEGRVLSAFYLLQLALDRAPAQDNAWALLGYVSARLSSAEQFLAERGPSRTTSIAPWEQLATRTAAGGFWEAAESYLRAGAERVGAALLPELRMADIALQLRQPPRATAYLEAAQAAYPDRPEPWLRLAEMSIGAGETSRAVALINAAEERGADAEAIKALRDQVGGAKPPSISGIERTVIR